MKFRRGSLHRLRRARASAQRIAIARTRPGAILRQARGKKGMTLSDAAEALRLPQATIAAIERDDYAHLPEVAYVLGYWRSYALLLEIDLEDSIAAHKNHLSHASQPRASRRASPGALARRGISLSFALLSVLLLLALWHSQRPQPQLPYFALEQGEQRRGYREDLPEPKTKTGAAEASLSPSPPSLFSLPEPIFNADMERAWQNARAQNDAQSSAQSLQSSPNEIVLSVGEDSWIEVRDSTNVQLVHQLVGRGKRLLLKGVPPFSVYVGNASGVAVEYRGQPVQFAASAGGPFARFNVGGR